MKALQKAQGFIETNAEATKNEEKQKDKVDEQNKDLFIRPPTPEYRDPRIDRKKNDNELERADTRARAIILL